MKKLLFIILLLFSSNIYSQIIPQTQEIPIYSIELKQKKSKESSQGRYYMKGILTIAPEGNITLDAEKFTYLTLEYIKEVKKIDDNGIVDIYYIYRDYLSGEIMYFKTLINDRAVTIESEYYILTIYY